MTQRRDELPLQSYFACVCGVCGCKSVRGVCGVRVRCMLVCVCDVCGMSVYVHEVCVVCVVWCMVAQVLLPFRPVQPVA